MPSDLGSVGASIIAQVRQRSTLVHCITAAVSMGIVADGLAAGVRPVMTETLEEAPTVDTIADALLINLGTLSTDAMTGIPATVEVALLKTGGRGCSTRPPSEPPRYARRWQGDSSIPGPPWCAATRPRSWSHRRRRRARGGLASVPRPCR